MVVMIPKPIKLYMKNPELQKIGKGWHWSKGRLVTVWKVQATSTNPVFVPAGMGLATKSALVMCKGPALLAEKDDSKC